jgi:hypothetical protein
MPRGLENWLSIGFALVLAPMIMFMAIRTSFGDHLAWLPLVGMIYLTVLAFDILNKNRLGLSGATGRWVVLAFAVIVLGYGGFDMYKMFGENVKVSPLSNNLVAFGWLLAIAGPFIIFGQLGSRPAVAWLTPDPADAKS